MHPRASRQEEALEDFHTKILALGRLGIFLGVFYAIVLFCSYFLLPARDRDAVTSLLWSGLALPPIILGGIILRERLWAVHVARYLVAVLALFFAFGTCLSLIGRNVWFLLLTTLFSILFSLYCVLCNRVLSLARYLHAAGVDPTAPPQSTPGADAE